MDELRLLKSTWNRQGALRGACHTGCDNFLRPADNLQAARPGTPPPGVELIRVYRSISSLLRPRRRLDRQDGAQWGSGLGEAALPVLWALGRQYQASRRSTTVTPAGGYAIPYLLPSSPPTWHFSPPACVPYPLGTRT